MRDEDVIPGIGSRPMGAYGATRRSGYCRFRLWTWRRLGVLFVTMVAVLFVTDVEGPSKQPAMRRIKCCAGVTLCTLVFSPDGNTIAALDHCGRVWLQLTTNRAIPAQLLDGLVGGRCMAFSPNGRFLAVGGQNPDVMLYDLDQGGPGQPLGIPTCDTGGLSFSPDGRTLALSSVCSREIILWDTEGKRLRRTLRGYTTPVTAVAFGPDGASLTSVSLAPGTPVGHRDVIIWDIDTGQPRVSWKERSVTSAFSPDGRLLASPDSFKLSTIRVRDLSSGSLVGPIINAEASIRSMAISTDGRLLAIGTTASTVSVWNVATGREIYRLDANGETLHQLAFSPDMQTLAAAGNNGDILLWERTPAAKVETGTLQGKLDAQVPSSAARPRTVFSAIL
jgi:WD40 repeat protein